MERKERLIDTLIGVSLGVALTLFVFAAVTQVPILTVAAGAFNLMFLILLFTTRWRRWGEEIEQREQQGNS